MTDKPNPAEKFVGIQVSPINFIDEGVETGLCDHEGKGLRHQLMLQEGAVLLPLERLAVFGLEQGGPVGVVLNGEIGRTGYPARPAAIPPPNRPACAWA